MIDRDGYVDPTDGGRTYRYSLSTSFQHTDPNGVTRLAAYGESYGLDLFSNFTYYQFDANDYYNVTANPVTCNPLYSTCAPGPQHVGTLYIILSESNVTPTGWYATTPGSITPAAFGYACGDQREQEDKRFVSGLNFTRSFTGRKATTTFGLGMRNDNIYVLGLYLTNAQNRLPNGTLSSDRVVERDVFSYLESEYRVGNKLRLAGGFACRHLQLDRRRLPAGELRYESRPRCSIRSSPPRMRCRPTTSSTSTSGIAFTATMRAERRQTLDPQTHATVDPTGAPVQQYAPLVRAWGEEVGYRFSNPKLTTTLSFWKLNIASELIFDGDHGRDDAERADRSQGHRVHQLLSPDAVADSRRGYCDIVGTLYHRPGQRRYVRSRIAQRRLRRRRDVGSSEIRRHPRNSSTFGPRVLDQLGDAVSSPTTIVSTQFSLKGHNGRRLNLDVFNLLNAQADDVDYFYGSWVPQDAKNPAYATNPAINPLLGGGGVNDYHFHPSQGRVVRLTYIFSP